MRPRLQGLRHVAVYVTDIDRSLAFYRDVMGMTLEWMPDPDNAYLTSGSDNLALHWRPGRGPVAEAQTLDHIGFVVPGPEDVDDWARYLRDRGVAISRAPKTHRDHIGTRTGHTCLHQTYRYFFTSLYELLLAAKPPQLRREAQPSQPQISGIFLGEQG